jgi:hypothetical protein
MAELTHREVLKRFDDHWQADRANREDAIDDLRFCAGDQWPDTVRQQRERDGRPVITINRMGQFVKRVSGSLRQSYPAIDPFPVDDKTDPVLADIYAGLIRQIEYVSSAGSVYAWAAECAIRCGIGHWQVKTRYQNEGFNQEIYICRITDPLSVTWDSGAVELDRSDAFECFVSELITKDEYYRRWPAQRKSGHVHSGFPNAPTLDSQLYWQTDDRIRIASRWFKQPKKKTMGMTADGQVFDITKLDPVSIQALGITRERKVDDWEIMHQPVSGDDFLDDAKLWPGRHIPIIPVIGEEVPLEGRVVRHGIIRWAKDPQRLYNYWRSASAEMIATAPKAPWLVSSKMIAGREAMWARANIGNPSVLVYEPDDGAPTLAPKRQDMAHPPVAMWQEATIAQDDMKAAIGIYDAALGNKSNETSGVAIEARQQEADTGSFVYFDNFNHAMHRGGVVLVDLIGAVMDGEQQVRIIGKDEREGFVPINKAVATIDGPAIINDLSTAKFDVRIKTGPSYANAKAEAKAGLNLILQADPNLMGALGDLWAETQDFPPDIKEKLVQRMKKMVPPGMTDEPAPPDPMQEMAVKTQLDEALAKIEKLKAESFKTEQDGIGKQIENQKQVISVAEYGIEPPGHVQKQEDREYDLHKANMGHAVKMSEAERGRLFSQQQAAQQPAQ